MEATKYVVVEGALEREGRGWVEDGMCDQRVREFDTAEEAEEAFCDCDPRKAFRDERAAGNRFMQDMGFFAALHVVHPGDEAFLEADVVEWVQWTADDEGREA